MQETKYINNDGVEERMMEVFYREQHEGRSDFIERMNNRLFALEMQGHTLVQQKPITLSEKIAIERAKKAKKKLSRL
jgi:hypothetical protein